MPEKMPGDVLHACALNRRLQRAPHMFKICPGHGAIENVRPLLARKTARLVEQLKAAEWQRSPRTDAEGQGEFWYQRDGWGKAYRFLALRYEKKGKAGAVDAPDQYQLFETSKYIYRVLFNREEGAEIGSMRHTTLATSRLRSCSWRPKSGAIPDEWVSAILVFVR